MTGLNFRALLPCTLSLLLCARENAAARETVEAGDSPGLWSAGNEATEGADTVAASLTAATGRRFIWRLTQAEREPRGERGRAGTAEREKAACTPEDVRGSQ